jgi:hypothetical protein
VLTQHYAMLQRNLHYTGVTSPKQTLGPFLRGCTSSNLQNSIGGRVRQLERVGDGATSDLAIVHIQAITQMWVIVERSAPECGCMKSVYSS